ncbi:sensor histidine kinase [Streptomyces laurentii]|uniref:sensor histidine kinase n=1 Tax=Streptomyces laurentii TaxID=39478 RepID=UPI0036C6A56A
MSARTTISGPATGVPATITAATGRAVPPVPRPPATATVTARALGEDAAAGGGPATDAPTTSSPATSSPATSSGTAPTPVEERWRQFFRWGPYALLTLATLISAASFDAFGEQAHPAAMAVLVPATLVLLVWWSLRQRALPVPAPGDRPACVAETSGGDGLPLMAPVLIPGAPGTASVVYFVLRTALALALTWANPLFAVFACVGYFDTAHLLPPRPAVTRAGLLVVAFTLAGSQSGGLPPRSGLQWVLFGGLFVINASLAIGLSHLGTKEAEKAMALARTNSRLEQALAENAALQAQLLLQAREAGIADERRRLAAEIHDTIAQGLTGVIAQLQAVTATADPAVADVHLRRAAELARHSLGEARRSVHNLGPAALELDSLPVALEKTVAAWAERTGITARFTATGTELPLHDEIAATLLRITEEALANAERHSGAARAGVTLSYMGDEITLDVRDDGRGFDPAAVPARTRAGGFGLGGMRARAERLAGALTVESEPGHGTAISARVPLAPQDGDGARDAA